MNIFKVKSNIRIFIAIAFMTIVNMSVIGSKAAAKPSSIVNGDFQYPSLATIAALYPEVESENRSYNISPDKGATSNGIDWTGDTLPIPGFDKDKFGWRSTQTITEPGVMEFQHYDTNDNNNIYVELCAFEKNTAIYQDIAATPDSVYTWELKHSSLNSSYIDKMQVLIGAVGSEKVSVATRIASNSGQQIGETSDTIASINGKTLGPTWNTYRGYAYIPAGQTTTRFTFKSIDSLSATNGNLLDDISFKIAYPLYYNLNGGDGNLPNPTDSNYSGYHNSGEKVSLSNVIPTKDNCTFIGWSTEKIDDIDSDTAYDTAKSKLIDSVAFNDSSVTVYAVYKMNSYSVKFIDGQTNDVLKTETVYYGHDATPPNVPDHKGYTSVDWDRDYTDITSDLIVTMQYSPISYMIRYEPNGATSGNMPTKNMRYNEKGTLDKNQFIRTGYIFAGWKSGGKSYADESEILNLAETNNETITFTAQWNPIKYTINFDKNRNDASGSTESMSMQYDETKALTLNGFTSASSIFTSWNTQANGSGITYTDQQKVKNLVDTNDGAITLYAQWSTNSYIVTFVDGLTGKTITSPSVNHGGSAIPPTKPIHKGYTALSWNGNYQNVTKNETVTLSYRKNAYQIAFKANGGTGSMPNEQMKYDETKALDMNTFIKTGYSFIGWRNQNTNDAYSDSQKVNNLTDIDGGTVTLIAQWKANSYVIRYDSNGGTGTMPNQTMEYDKASPLSANEFKKEGYSFIGWKRDDKMSGKSYTNRESVINLLPDNGGTTTMYAQWKANTYTVTFVDGHNGKMITTETVQHGESAKEPAKPVHEGYTATNWDTSLSNVTSDTTITLNYRPNKYTIKFNGNGADVKGTTANKLMEYDKEDQLTANGYSRTGYTWLGWAESADGNGNQYSDKQRVTNLTSIDGGVVTIYAKWKINRYTVTFIDGQTNDVISREEVDYESNAAVPEAPIHTGYKLAGWSSDGRNITGDMTITASYAPISYAVAFDKNSDKASGEMANQQMKYDTWDNLHSNVFIRNGYHFIGWNTQPDNSGMTYTDGERIYNLTENDNDIVTLYAQWIENDHIAITYKVESDDGLGDNSVSNVLDDINPITGVPTGSVAKVTEAYEFIGWYDSNNKLLSTDEEFMPSKPDNSNWIDATYTAKFKRKIFDVSFIDKNGEVIKSEKIPYGSSATAPDAPSVNGYEFVGWDRTFDNVTADIEVKAIYNELSKPSPHEPIADDSSSKKIEETKHGNVSNDLVQTGIEISPFIAGTVIVIIGIYYAIHKKH